MKVLLIGPTGNLGQRLTAALLAHNHTLTVFVRSAKKLETLLPSSIHHRVKIIQGDATDSAAIKDAIRTSRCDAVVNSAGVAALAPWGRSTLPEIFHAVLTAVVEASDEGMVPLRAWFLGGMGVLYYPHTRTMLSNYIPIFLAHRPNLRLLRALPPDTLDWSMLCPSTLNPASPTLSLTATPKPLLATAHEPPNFQDSWLRHIPWIGKAVTTARNASRYVATLEQAAEFIAADLEARESRWIGVAVGVIDPEK